MNLYICGQCAGLIGRAPSQARGKKVFCSSRCMGLERRGRSTYIRTPEHNALMREATRDSIASRNWYGSLNPNWRGGTSLERHLAMSRKEYKAWRKAVYERDNYACVECATPGNGKNLNADHIKAYSLYPELRLEVSNGRTLCIDCHKQTDTYGWKIFNQLRRAAQ